MSAEELDFEEFQSLFGNLAVKKGFITSEEFVQALKRQVFEEIENGQLRPVASILHEQGRITSLQIDDVLETLKEAKRLAPFANSWNS